MVGKDEVTFFGYHVVCLIDVLGQKQKLDKWKMPPESGKLTPEFIAALKETAGAVLGYREHFRTFFAQFASVPIHEKFKALPRELMEKYRRAKDCRVVVERHSDTLVFSASIASIEGDALVGAVYPVLSACCMAMVVSLAAKVPVRGAVAVGMGAILEDGGFYGPALAEAHHIESEVSNYPRIVVAPSVIELLRSVSAYSQDLQLEKIMRRFASLSQSLICQDADGYWIVDYFGKGFRKVNSSFEKDLVVSAYDFVRSEENRFQASGDPKLADRYRRLREYVESRLPLWGVPIA